MCGKLDYSSMLRVLQLRVEGAKLWAEGIIAVYGNIKLEWFDWNEELKSCKCKLFLTNGQEEIYG